jgi:hypothetical protein
MDLKTSDFVVQILYYDGQFNDSRLNVTLAISAAAAGATVLNYADVTKLLKVGCLPFVHPKDLFDTLLSLAYHTVGSHTCTPTHTDTRAHCLVFLIQSII